MTTGTGLLSAVAARAAGQVVPLLSTTFLPLRSCTDLIGESLGTRIASLVVCLEDAVAETDVQQGLNNLKNLLLGIEARGGRRGDALQDVQRDIFLQRTSLDPTRTQMIQREVARGLIDEGFEVVDRSLTEGPGDAQVGFLQQVLGGAVVIHHPLQGAKQNHPLGEKDVVEARLAHSDTRPVCS